MNTYESFVSAHKVEGFVYNEETRIHTLNGKIIPSVSQIAEPLSTDYSKIPPRTLKNKQDLGVQLHGLIELYTTDDLSKTGEDEFLDEVPQLRLPFESFKEYWTIPHIDNGYLDSLRPFITLAVEQPFCNVKLKYCGKPDHVKDDCIIDFKLRPYDPICDPIRMAGYAGLVSDFPKKKLTVVSFDLNGNRKIHDADKKGAWGMFREMLKKYWENMKHQELLENWRKACQ